MGAKLPVRRDLFLTFSAFMHKAVKGLDLLQRPQRLVRLIRRLMLLLRVMHLWSPMQASHGPAWLLLLHGTGMLALVGTLHGTRPAVPLDRGWMLQFTLDGDSIETFADGCKTPNHLDPRLLCL
jgi:hypothetical protein